MYNRKMNGYFIATMYRTSCKHDLITMQGFEISFPNLQFVGDENSKFRGWFVTSVSRRRNFSKKRNNTRGVS